MKWDIEHAAMKELKAQNERLRSSLAAAKEKLSLYRCIYGGEYVGGMEYSALMKQIAEALRVDQRDESK